MLYGHQNMQPQLCYMLIKERAVQNFLFLLGVQFLRNVVRHNLKTPFQMLKTDLAVPSF
jgi:hypothetical protein